MAITGSLSEFSLPEIFQFLDQGQKTGMLTIRDPHDTHTGKPLLRHIWLHQGRVIAAGDRLDGRGLFTLIEQRGWLAKGDRDRIEQLLGEKIPLGLNLKSSGLLQADQLKLLFSVQVLRQMCALFQVETGLFRFDANTDLPKAEMTGLSLPATEATLMGLRSLKNWTILQSKLPETSSTLFNLAGEQPHLRLDKTERQMWEFANGTTSLKRIAEQLDHPLETIQQVAFRLIVVGLVEEVPMLDGGNSNASSYDIPEVADVNEKPAGDAERTVVSNSFLQSLVGFLQHKH